MRTYIAKKSSKSSSIDSIKYPNKEKQLKIIKKTILKVISKVVMSLSIIEFAQALEIFNGKILLLAAGVCLLTGLIKLAIPAKARKYVTVLPFILGILVCAGFDFFFENANPLTPHTVSTGLQCGVASTIYYVVYDQFFKGGNSEQTTLLTGLLSGIIHADSVKDSAKSILKTLSEGGDDTAKKIYEILSADKSDGITAEELMLTVKNIINSIKS